MQVNTPASLRPNRTEIKPEFLGGSADNSMIANISSPRGCMHSSHFASHLPLLYPDEKIVKSGIEYEMGKTINDIRADYDCVVKAVIPKYQGNVSESPDHLIFVEFIRDGQLFIDFIDVPYYKSQHNFFGYRLTPTELMQDLGYNTTLRKGDILAKANSYGVDGAYNSGVNANVVFMSHPSVAEDGIVISESFAKRSASESYIKRVVNITKNTIPLNLYGDANTYKFLPEIGQMVRPDGLLCATRERNDWFSISDMNVSNLSEEDPTFDSLTYVNTHSQVVDIAIIKGNSGKSEFSSAMTAQLDRYAGMLTGFYQQVIRTYETILAEKKSLYKTMDNVRLTPRLHRFITDSYIKVNMTESNRNRMCYRKLPIDQYRIEIITKSTVVPNYGHKLSDNHA